MSVAKTPHCLKVALREQGTLTSFRYARPSLSVWSWALLWTVSEYFVWMFTMPHATGEIGFGPRKVMASLLVIGAIPSGLAGTVTTAHGLYVVRFFIGKMSSLSALPTG